MAETYVMAFVTTVKFVTVCYLSVMTQAVASLLKGKRRLVSTGVCEQNDVSRRVRVYGHHRF